MFAKEAGNQESGIKDLRSLPAPNTRLKLDLATTSQSPEAPSCSAKGRRQIALSFSLGQFGEILHRTAFKLSAFFGAL
jgi:hypothetical protein